MPESSPKSSHHSLAGAVRTVALVTMLSRLFGMARDLVMVRVFGDTPIGSAFNFAFGLPNLFRRLFGEGALSAAFIPEYAAAVKSDPKLAARLASLTVAILALATGGLTIVCELIVAAVLLLAPGDAEAALSYRLILFTLPFMPLVCIAATLGGMLQVHNRFGPPAAAPIILNLCMIAGAVPHFLAGESADAARSAYVIGASTVAAGAVQLVWCLYFLRRNIRWTRTFQGAGQAARRMFKRYIPVMIGLGTLQLGSLLDSLIAMYPIWVGATLVGFIYPLDGASNAILAPTQHLYQFPLGVFGIAVATAVFPMLSRHADEPAEFVRTLRRGLRLSLFIGLPASVGLMLVREDLIAVLFGRSGEEGPGFSEGGVQRSAAVLMGYAPAIWAYSLNHVLTRAFYARGNTATPTKVAVSMVGMNLMLNCTLIWFLREAGLAWATSITATVQCAILWRLLRGRLGSEPGITDVATRAAMARILGAAAGMAGAVLIAMWLAPDADGVRSMRALRLGIGCAAGVVAYGAISMAIGGEELRWLMQRKR